MVPEICVSVNISDCPLSPCMAGQSFAGSPKNQTRAVAALSADPGPAEPQDRIWRLDDADVFDYHVSISVRRSPHEEAAL
jgi:hypothetical protein